MIKNLIFDNNGVLATSDREATLMKIADYLELTFADVEKPWLQEYSKLNDGIITSDQFLRKVLFRLAREGKFEGVKRIYFNCYENKEEMHELAKKLSKSYRLALISNFGDAFSEFNKKWKLEEIFGDSIFVSCFLKMHKPNPEIFKYVLEIMNMNPSETIFIDDKEENVKTAIALGMHVILFNTPEQFQNDLKSILDKENSDEE